MAYIGVDIGTSGCKTAILDEKGQILKLASCSYEMVRPKAGWVELNPLDVWQAVRKTLCEIAPYGKEATSLAVSSLGESMVFLDQKDQPLMNGILYLDERSTGQFRRVMEEVGEKEMLALTGTPANPMFSLYRYLWVQEHMPEVLEQTKYIFLFVDYIGYMLTGERGIDPSLASRTALFDVQKGDWSEELMDWYGIRRELFSPVRNAGEILGVLRPECAEELGLPESLVVRIGCHDQCAATLGGGAFKEGDMVSGQGSTESYNLLVPKGHPLLKEARHKTGYEPYVIPDCCFVTAGQLAYGTCIRWFAEKIQQELFLRCQEEGKNIYTELDARCTETSDGVVFLPNLTKVQFDGSKSSLGCFLGVDVGTDYRHLYRAVLEGISFESRTVLAQFDAFDVEAQSMHVVGGVTKSENLMQIKADILRKEICVMREKEAGVLGLAIICAVGEGAFAGYAEAVRALVREKKVFMPERSYEEEYERYKEFSRLVRQYFTPED